MRQTSKNRNKTFGTNRRSGNFIQIIRYTFAIATTPIILVIGTGNQLYFTNQKELHYDLKVYIPLFGIFIFISIVGTLLILLQNKKFRFVTFLSWLYLLTGPLYLLTSFLSKIKIIASHQKLAAIFLYTLFILVSLKFTSKSE